MLLLGCHGQMRVAVSGPIRDVGGINERVVVEELQPDEIRRSRRRQRYTEETLSELFAGRGVPVGMGFGVRGELWDRVDEPESLFLVERDDALCVAHREAGVAVGVLVVVQDVKEVIFG